MARLAVVIAARGSRNDFDLDPARLAVPAVRAELGRLDEPLTRRRRSRGARCGVRTLFDTNPAAFSIRLAFFLRASSWSTCMRIRSSITPIRVLQILRRCLLGVVEFADFGRGPFTDRFQVGVQRLASGHQVF